MVEMNSGSESHPVYFFLVDSSLNPCNKLDDEVREQFKKHNNSLVSNRYKFLEMLKDVVKEANNLHKRCKPLNVESFINSYDSQMSVYVTKDKGYVIIASSFRKIVNDYTHYPHE